MDQLFDHWAVQEQNSDTGRDPSKCRLLFYFFFFFYFKMSQKWHLHDFPWETWDPELSAFSRNLSIDFDVLWTRT